MNRNPRLFVAIEPPDTIIGHIGDITRILGQEKLKAIRWVRPEGVHLTLKFLGNVAEDQVTDIVAAMSTAVTGVSPFVVHVHGLGAFPNLSAPRVLWVSIRGNLEPLMRVYARLEEELAPKGFCRQHRAFSPHLTLGRLKNRLPAQELQRLNQAMNMAKDDLKPSEFPILTLSLLESRLTPNGALYRRKAQIHLNDSSAHL